MNHLSSTLVLCDLDHLLLGADGNLTQVGWLLSAHLRLLLHGFHVLHVHRTLQSGCTLFFIPTGNEGTQQSLQH